MTEIQQNRYDRLIRRLTNVVGGGSEVNDTLAELFPVIDVEPTLGELLSIMGTRTGFGTAVNNAGGGLDPQLQLFNPVDSNTLITVTSVIVSAVVDQDIAWSIDTTPFTTLLTRGSLRDTRLRDAAANTTVGELRTQATAVPIGAAGRAFVLGNRPFQLWDENDICVLSPGFGLEFEGSVATFLSATYYWRERTAEPSELNL